MRKRKQDKRPAKAVLRIEDSRKADIIRELAKKLPGSVVHSFENGKAFIRRANGSIIDIDMLKTSTKKIGEIAQGEYRESRLKKHPIEEREAKTLRLIKRQKIVGVIEDARKPVIIQAPKGIPRKGSRTELRKLEQEIRKKTEKMADSEFPFFKVDIENGLADVRGRDGRLQPHPLNEETLKKYRKLMGETKRNIGKGEREELR